MSQSMLMLSGDKNWAYCPKCRSTVGRAGWVEGFEGPECPYCRNQVRSAR